MAVLSSENRTRLEAQLAAIEAQIVIANATFVELLGQRVESYRFDSGEGSQQAKNKDADSLLLTIDRLEARADWIRNRLNGRGVVNINVRRKVGRRVR